MKKHLGTDELWRIRSEANHRFAVAERNYRKTGSFGAFRDELNGIDAFLKSKKRLTEYRSQLRTLGMMTTFWVKAGVLRDAAEKRRSPSAEGTEAGNGK